MSTATRERLLFSALEKLPAVQAARQQAEADRCERRRQWLQAVEAARNRFERTDAALIGKADPIERRLAVVRSEVADLEAALEPLARDRIAAMSEADAETRALRKELTSDAVECSELQRSIDLTHCEVSGNAGGRRSVVLDSMAPSQARVTIALAVLLEAYREVGRVAAEEAGIGSALAALREQLTRAGLRLLDGSTSHG